MYKTRLQELCQHRKWALPKYSAMKDGPDHMPSFKASVTVNGDTFTSAGAFKSSKEAHNQAAMVAFRSFIPTPLGSSTPAATKNDTEEQVGAATPQNIPILVQSSPIIDGINPSCKCELQNYARRNNLDPPIFTIQTEGLPHEPHFKATVVVDGKSFESPAFFKTVKEAEEGVAKIALMSLSPGISNKGDSSPFKSLLLELTQREGFRKPTYKTTQSGSSHIPTFYSTVVVESEEFHGKVSISKNEAEQDAAKIAYVALKECGLHKYTFLTSYLRENKAVPSIHRSDIFKSKKNLNHEDELMDLDFSETLPSNVKVSNGVNNPSFLHSPEKSMMRNKAKTPETNSCMLYSKFKVYTSYPNVAFPEGTIVLPISDSKWVAVSLEFPNEKGN